MKFTSTLILATAALTSATAIDMDPAAPAKWDNLRIQFTQDYDCKWTDKKDKVHTNDPPECNHKQYKALSHKFNKHDEFGQCHSHIDLEFPKGQENFHSFSFCLPPRLQKKGCAIHLFDNFHCEGAPILNFDTKKNEKYGTFMDQRQCMNVDEGYAEEHIGEGGARSVKIYCPARDSTCDADDVKEADDWE